MTDQLIDRIVEEVLVRIDQKDTSEKQALLIYTGGTLGRAEGIKAAKSLKRGGWSTEVMVTEAGRQIGTLDLLPEGARVFENSWGSAKILATDYKRILVPVMTITTASKIAKMIWDTPAAYVIGTSLSMGKEVWAAKDACDFSLRSKAPKAMRDMSLRVMNTLESFGVRWCDSKDLYRDLVFAKATNPGMTQLPQGQAKVEKLPDLCRIGRIEKHVVTRGDLIPYLEGFERIELQNGAILTPLAKEELKNNRIQWIWVDGGMK